MCPIRTGGKWNITPTEHTFGIEVIDKRIKDELKSVRVVIETFLKSPEPPTWVPPDYAKRNREFLASLRIPSYRNGNPSLLLHNLRVYDGDEIRRIFADARPLCICNTSGSGKTRRMLEGLTEYWGFYLVAAPDVNGVGVGDLRDALADVTQYREWMSDLRPLSSWERAGQSVCNSQIASKLLKKVLAARIVVFQLFLELAIRVDGNLQEKHKHIWLLFQLFDQLHPQLKGQHPFVSIMKKCLRNASTQALDILLDRLETICSCHLPLSPFIIGLDEAQHAVRSYRHSFVSSTNNEVLRSMLREIVKVFTILPTKLVVSGTGLPLDEVHESTTSGVSKPAEAVILFHNLGMFDSWLKLKPFLDCYVPVSFWNTSSGYRLQQRIQEYLLGRYRFSVSFLEYFLRNGLESPHKLLNAYIKGHTTCLPGDSGSPFTLDEPELHIAVKMTSFEWDRLQHDPHALQEAAQVMKSHLIKGGYPMFGPVNAQLVEYGIACLCKGHKCQIVEPLAFLSLMQWLKNQTTANLLAVQSPRGGASEELVVLHLLRALRCAVPLSTIFNFHGTPPSWADEMSQVIGSHSGIAVSVGILGGTPQGLGLSMVHYAANITDVLNWIGNLTTSSAVLIPTTLFGPDVLVWSSGVLLMGQFKSYMKGNKQSLDAAMTSQALTSLHPDHWFKYSPPHLRQKLIHAIERHRVLRFIGGYPIPVLDSGATSVRNAITALGPEVVLATINFDTFRAQFITEDQARDVLQLTDHALTCKRKADEVDSSVA